MNRQRLERLLGLLERADPSQPVLTRLCAVGVEAVDVDGAGLSRIQGATYQLLASSDPGAEAIEQLQLQHREGPCFDAVRLAEPVLELDLARDEVVRRWPGFASGAISRGVRAAFGFPLQSSAGIVGALDLYSRTLGGLSETQIDDALLIAELAALAIDDRVPAGSPLEEVLRRRPPEPWAYRAVVHHAAGMTSDQLAISVDDALIRLRAHTFSVGRSVEDVAADIVGRRLRLESWGDDERG